MKSPEICYCAQNKIRNLIAGILILLVQFSFAQNKKGDIILQTGIALMPGINTTADIGLTPKVSFGIGYTHTWYSENYTRDNFGLRMLYHFNNENNWDFFLGGRFGMSKWKSDGNQSTNPFFFYTNRDLGKQYPSIQFVVGGRYLFNQCFGFYTEVAFGFPYFGSAGICANINNCIKAIGGKNKSVPPEPPTNG